MADLYPQTYSNRPPPPPPSYHHHHRQDTAPQQQYHLSSPSSLVYPPLIPSTSSSIHDSNANSADHTSHDSHSQSPQRADSQSPKPDSPSASKPDGTAQQPAKPQATFLTKLYALLERPENHHMIRWDPAGEHIIVERPEQLALHVLPSVYRQSRFASFSRQLNIYGFMRKVNLRNVDPAIDDPDASTWSHPTLNRHSPPEVVANFKRRVPPRLPKPRKRDNDVPQIPPPRSAGGPGVPSIGTRARGFSAPGSFTPLSQPGAAGWATSYPRSTLPPLTVPNEPMHTGGLYGSTTATSTTHGHTLHPITTTASADDGFTSMGYGNANPRGGDGMLLPSPSSGYSYGDQTSAWSFSPSSASSHSSGSLSSLLNPSSGVSGGYATATNAGGAGGRPTPAAINTYSSYSSSASMGIGGLRHGHHTGTATPVSPESRPTTGYSVSSMTSLSTPYEDHHGHPHGFTHDYSRPGSSHHRPMTPSSSRPPSSKSYQSQNGAGTPTGQQGGLSVRRARRHSQAISPYPSPYGEHHHHPPQSAGSERPSTSPQPDSHHHHHPGAGGLAKVRSMIQLPAVDTYSFNPSQADFAYGAVEEHHPHAHPHGHSAHAGMYGRSVRPSTSASSLSTSSSANTPGGDGYAPSSSAGAPTTGGAGGGADADISRFSPDFGFVQMNEHIPPYAKTEM